MFDRIKKQYHFFQNRKFRTKKEATLATITYSVLDYFSTFLRIHKHTIQPKNRYVNRPYFSRFPTRFFTQNISEKGAYPPSVLEKFINFVVWISLRS